MLQKFEQVAKVPRSCKVEAIRRVIAVSGRGEGLAFATGKFLYHMTRLNVSSLQPGYETLFLAMCETAKSLQREGEIVMAFPREILLWYATLACDEAVQALRMLGFRLDTRHEAGLSVRANMKRQVKNMKSRGGNSEMLLMITVNHSRLDLNGSAENAAVVHRSSFSALIDEMDVIMQCLFND